ncbi:MAG: peptide deformylase [Candidatus Omnitrophica bacterium]|nr:peptide deformylase [Candidatus Omnitrophota bacterium]
MKEIKLRIKVFGDSALRKKSVPVEKITEEHRRILSSMANLMYSSSGVGLAAPQVGINECMIVVDIGEGLYKLINPQIIRRQGRQVLEEGCLSVPGISIKVKRAAKVTVKALDEYGKPVEINAEKLLACVFQHEIDHIKGKLIVDYASLFDRIKIKKKLAELKKRAEDEKLSQPERESSKLQL